MLDTQQEIIEFIKKVADNYDSRPDSWSSCLQCENNKSDTEDLLELIGEQTQPTDTEMLEFIIKKGAYIYLSRDKKLFQIVIGFYWSDPYQTPRQAIAAEMLKEATK